MSNLKVQQPIGAPGRRLNPTVGIREKQLMLLPIFPTEPWKSLGTESLQLDKETYGKICRCYREVFDAYLPGQGSEPFYTQVSKQLASAGLTIKPRAIARLVSRAQEAGIDHFPDPRTRAVSSSSAKAAKLQNPAGSKRMPADAHNAFAEIYRTLLRTWRKKGKRDEGFFRQAAALMLERGHNFTEKQLSFYAHFRRRIGDVNFPRVKGSQDIERMQIAAVERMRALGVMATGLMHEILQPLQVIQSTAEHQKREIEKGAVDRDRVSERLERIVTQAKLINQVVQHVRTVARTGEPRVEAVELRSTIERGLSLFGEQLRSRGIEVDWSGVPVGPPGR